MKVNKWVAVLATCSVLAVAAPVSAQFGGFKSLKKAMDTVAKELEQPKPAPQPQPTARPTPPQSRPATSQGGYASPAPVRAQQVTAPSTPVVRQAVTNEVVATEAWRCFGESDATPIKLEFSYSKNKNGLRNGTVKMIESYEYDENSNYAPRNEVEARIFTSNGIIYNLKFNNNEIGKMNFEISNDRFGGGDQSAKSRYTGYSLMEDIKHLNQIVPQEVIDQSEDFGGDTNAISCRIVKPIYSIYSFEDFSIDNPETIFESYREKPKKPNFAYRDKEFGPIGSELYKSIVKAVSDDDYEMPSFAKYYITVYKFGHHYLIDSRDGKVHHLTGDINNDPNIVGDIVGQSISILFNQNSNVVISITKDDSICQINYSKWDGSKLKIFDKQILGEVSVCVNEGGYDRENLLQLLEDQIIRGERTVPAKTSPPAPPQASTPSETAFATPTNTSASILGKWIPSDDDELHENQRTITRDGIEGYEWQCEFTLPVSDFQRYSGTEKCSFYDGVSGGMNSDGSSNITIELLDADTILYSKNDKDGTVKYYWKRSNIEE